MSLPGEIINLWTFYKTAAAVAIGDEYITVALIKIAPEEFILSHVRGRVQMGKSAILRDRGRRSRLNFVLRRIRNASNS